LIGGRLPGAVQSLAFTSDGRGFVAARGERVAFIDLVTNAERDVDGEWCATVGDVPALSVQAGIMAAPLYSAVDGRGTWREAAWRLDDHSMLWVDPPSATPLWTHAMTGDGAVMAGLEPNSGQGVWLRDSKTGAVLHRLRLETAPGSRVVSMEFSEDGRTLYAASTSARAGAWRTATGELVWVWPLPGSVPEPSTTVSRDGHRLAFECSDNSIAILETATGRVVRRLDATGDMSVALAFSPNGSRLASGGKDHCIRLWDVTTGTQTFIGRDFEGDVSDVCWSPDGRWLAAGDTLGTVVLRHSPNP
jgi:WD40 repeat protein